MSRLALAGGLGLLAWGFTVLLAGLRMAFNPGLWDRLSAASLGWTLAYAGVFACAAILCERLGGVPLRPLRYLLVGAVAGAVLWSYLMLTWAFTAGATAVLEPQAGLPEALLAGAALGAGGGLLLDLLARLRS